MKNLSRKIIIDTKKASVQQNKLWRGMGMVSGNNSSRLLIDYKALHPKEYNEILELIFGKNGINVQHLKIEMGSDINSSSGTEPCTMRSPTENANVFRGAGFILCADAKKINPNLTLDMLWWSEPKWIENSENVYESRYEWYKQNLVQAYKEFQLKFDFVSATQNERGWDFNWIKFLSNRLKTDKNVPYDFSKIKIVIGDEVGTWMQAEEMLKDEELLNAVDVVGSHYTSWAPENVWKLRDLGKEIWFSEGSSPMGFSKGTPKYDGNGSGLNGLNGILDVANRIITMFPGGKMTLYEFQPIIASYYDGVTYCHKQFITANTPWNGFYEIDPSFYMTLHFSQFIKKDWSILDDACFGDGKAAGDGHSIADATFSYLTGCNPKTNDWSVVITNTTNEKIEYEINDIGHTNFENIYFYETSGISTEKILQKSVLNFSSKCIKITLKPNSLITLSTLDVNFPIFDFAFPQKNDFFTLPYKDDFSYKNFDADFLRLRGDAPLFTTDEGGAFEIVNLGGKNVLQQKIENTNRAKEWGLSPNPTTNLGDDRWLNYFACVKVKFAENSILKNENYAGIGIRYNLADSGQSGYLIKLFENGNWTFCHKNDDVKSGKIKNLKEWNLLKIQAEENLITIWINEKQILSETTEKLGISMQAGGRVALFSNFDKNLFSNLEIYPVGKNPYITRYDNFDDCFEYIETEKSHWEHCTMGSFKQYKRTSSKGFSGSKLKLNFKGKSFYLVGSCDEKTIFKIKIDGKDFDKTFECENVSDREVLCYKNNLPNKMHNVEIEILFGTCKIDSVEIGE